MARISSKEFMRLGFDAGLSPEEVTARLKADRESHGAFSDEAPAAPVAAAAQGRPPAPFGGQDPQLGMLSKYGAEAAAFPSFYNKVESGAPMSGLEMTGDVLTSWARGLQAATTTPLGYLGSKFAAGPAKVSRGTSPAFDIAPRHPRQGPPVPGIPSAPTNAFGYDPTDSFYGNFLRQWAQGGSIVNDPTLAAQIATGGAIGRGAEALVGQVARRLPSIPVVRRLSSIPIASPVARVASRLGLEGAVQGAEYAGGNKALGNDVNPAEAMAGGAAANIVLGGVPYGLGSLARALRKGAEPTVEALRPLTGAPEIAPERLQPDEFGLQTTPAQEMRGQPGNETRMQAEQYIQKEPVLGEYPRNMKESNLRAVGKNLQETRNQFPGRHQDIATVLADLENSGKDLKKALDVAHDVVGETFAGRLEQIGNQPAVAPDLGEVRQAVKDALTKRGLAPDEVAASMRIFEGAGGKEAYRGLKVETPAEPTQAEISQQRQAGALFQGEEELPIGYTVTPALGGEFQVVDAGGNNIFGARPKSTRRGAISEALSTLGNNHPDRLPYLPQGFKLKYDPSGAGGAWKFIGENGHTIESSDNRASVLSNAIRYAESGSNTSGALRQWAERHPRNPNRAPATGPDDLDALRQWAERHPRNINRAPATGPDVHTNAPQGLGLNTENGMGFPPQTQNQIPAGYQLGQAPNGNWFIHSPSHERILTAPNQREMLNLIRANADNDAWPPALRDWARNLGPTVEGAAAITRTFNENRNAAAPQVTRLPRGMVLTPNANGVGYVVRSSDGTEVANGITAADATENLRAQIAHEIQQYPDLGAQAPQDWRDFAANTPPAPEAPQAPRAQIAPQGGQHQIPRVIQPTGTPLHTDALPEGYEFFTADDLDPAHRYAIRHESGDIIGVGSNEAEAFRDALGADAGFESDVRGLAIARANRSQLPLGWTLNQASSADLGIHPELSPHDWIVENEDGDLISHGDVQDALEEAFHSPHYQEAIADERGGTVPEARQIVPPEAGAVRQHGEQATPTVQPGENITTFDGALPEGYTFEQGAAGHQVVGPRGSIIGSGSSPERAYTLALTASGRFRDLMKDLRVAQANTHLMPRGWKMRPMTRLEIRDAAVEDGGWVIQNDNNEWVGWGKIEHALKEAFENPEYAQANLQGAPPAAGTPALPAPERQAADARAAAQNEVEMAGARLQQNIVEKRNLKTLPEGFSIDKVEAQKYEAKDKEGQVVATGRTHGEAAQEAAKAVKLREKVPYEGPWKQKAPVFKSGLLDVVKKLPQSAFATGKTLLKQITQAKGSKPAELKWTGAQMYIEGHPGPVSKKELENWIASQEVHVDVDVKQSGDIVPFSPTDENGNVNTSAGWKDERGNAQGLNGTAVASYKDKENGFNWTYMEDSQGKPYYQAKRGAWASSVHKAISGVENDIRAKFKDEFPLLPFSEYNLPGTKNRTEIKLFQTDEQIQAKIDRVDEFMASLPDGQAPPEWAKKYKRMLEVSKEAKFTGGHWSNIKNYFAHARVDQSTYKGQGATVVQEIQSDVGNWARELRSGKTESFRPMDAKEKAKALAAGKTLEKRGELTVEEMDAAEARINKLLQDLKESGILGDGADRAIQNLKSAFEEERKRLGLRARTLPYSGSGYMGMGFKAALRLAAERGDKYLIIPHGKYQAMRYNKPLDGPDASGLIKAYDEDLIPYAKKYAAQWNAKVEDGVWDPFIDPNEINPSNESRLQRHGGLDEYLGASRPGGEVGYDATIIEITPEMAQSAVYEGSPLYQKQKGAIKGAYQPGSETLTLFPKADISTFGHEALGHRLRSKWIKATELKPFTDWMEAQGIKVTGKNGKWTVKAEEAFAKAVESMLYTGEANVPGMEKPLAKVAVAMKKLYEAGDLPEVTPAMKAAWEKTLTPKEIVANMKQQVTATPTGPGEILVENEAQKASKKILEEFGVDYNNPEADAASSVPPADAQLVRKYIDAAEHAKTFTQVSNLRRNLGDEHFEGKKAGLYSKTRGDVLLNKVYAALHDVGKNVLRKNLPPDLSKELINMYEIMNSEITRNRRVINEINLNIGSSLPAFKPNKAPLYMAYVFEPEKIRMLVDAAAKSKDLQPLLEQVRSTIVDGYFGSSMVTAGTSPNMWRPSPAKLISNWAKIPKETKQAMFEDGGERWTRFLGRLSKLQFADADLFNPSGTARLLQGNGFMKSLFSPTDWAPMVAERYVKKLLLPNVKKYYETGSFGEMKGLFAVLEALKNAEKAGKSRGLRTALTAGQLPGQKNQTETIGEMKQRLKDEGR